MITNDFFYKTQNERTNMYSKIYTIDGDELVILMHLMLLRNWDWRIGLSRVPIQKKLWIIYDTIQKGKARILVLLDINMPEITGFEF